MISEERTERYEFLLKNDPNAVKFCTDLLYVARVWDDLVDRDRKVETKEICKAFRIALYDIPQNPFFRYYQDEIRPVMLSAILAWQNSNVLAKGDETARRYAYVLREGFLRVLLHCAALVGGIEWAEQIGPLVEISYAEPWDAYQQTLERTGGEKCQSEQR